LEMHRHQHPLASTLSLTRDYLVDDVYIGDPGVSDKTYNQLTEYLEHGGLLLYATSINKKWDTYIFKNHKNRLDVSRDVIRSEASRPANKNDSIEPENTERRKKGSITLDNNKYMRYKGELQIVKHELPADEKVNVIGQICGRDVSLLDFIQSGTTFQITREAT